MQTDEKQYTALIVDDQPDFIHLAEEILTTEGGFQVVGSATSCDEALLLLDRYQPDLALVDVHMPEMNGFELTKMFVVRSPRTQVVLVTSLPGPEWPALAGEAGAASLLGKAALSGIALRSLLGGALPQVAAGQGRQAWAAPNACCRRDATPKGTRIMAGHRAVGFSR